jgi:3-oxoadipate enol-lactonase
MPKVKANGIEIYYEITGSGQPLLLISELGYGLWQWHKMVPGLAAHFQVITFDNRGAGQTDKPAGPYTVSMLAADTAALLKALGVGPAIVLGHSMGGLVAQELALTRPELISTLVLASSNFGGPNHIPVTPEAMAVLTDITGDPVERMRRGTAVAFAAGFAEAHPHVVEELTAYRLSVPVPPEAYQAQLAVGLALLHTGFEERLKALQLPTIIFTGDQDNVVPSGNADLLVRVIANSRVYVLSNAGHLFPFEAPNRAVAALLELLRGEV